SELMRKGWAFVALIALVGIGGFALSWTGTEDDVKSDFTIYMEEPIVREGGVVIIQPEAVDLEGDEFTKLTTGTHELTISSQVTIVRIQYPRDG
ncbi:hypothetical protein ACG74X_21255, partial [Marivita sp. S0852]|uniref:hypothetical protein n=1 Tax=Marivita sp. S0852 TaxID=3373893 RepID=UPI003982A272